LLSEKGRQDFQCLLQLFIPGVVEKRRDHDLSLRRVFNLDMREHFAQIQIQASGQIDQGVQGGIFPASLNAAEIRNANFDGKLGYN
jgi:hypothetical protein